MANASCFIPQLAIYLKYFQKIQFRLPWIRIFYPTAALLNCAFITILNHSSPLFVTVWSLWICDVLYDELVLLAVILLLYRLRQHQSTSNNNNDDDDNDDDDDYNDIVDDDNSDDDDDYDDIVDDDDNIDDDEDYNKIVDDYDDHIYKNELCILIYFIYKWYLHSAIEIAGLRANFTWNKISILVQKRYFAILTSTKFWGVLYL